MIKRIKAWREKRRLDRERDGMVEALNKKYGGDWYFDHKDGLGRDVYYDSATDRVVRDLGVDPC